MGSMTIASVTKHFITPSVHIAKPTSLNRGHRV